MRGSGLVVRLIDIVLILLMGFLLISDIVHKDQIKLPRQAVAQNKPQKQKKKIIPLKIKVMPITDEDKIELSPELKKINPEKEKSLIKLSELRCYYVVLDSVKPRKIQLLDKLERYLDSTKTYYDAVGDSLIVVINPDSNSMIQGTINLINICRMYDIKRSFLYREGGS